MRPRTIRLASTALFLLMFAPSMASAEVIRPILFPVSGPASFTDTFNDGRSGGRSHEGIDILSAKMTPLVAVMDGRIDFITETEQSYGWMLQVRDNDGWEYWYLHINNDTPGTDDGKGGREHAFAPGISRGTRVTKGQLLGWVGDSGNAESTVPHLHFEMHEPGSGLAVNPYETLRAAERPGRFDRAAMTLASPDINTDKRLIGFPGQPMFCVSGSLIRSVSNAAVYYCGANGKRYVFPNTKVYNSWYKDFNGVQKITDVELAAIPLGGNVTYKPGTKLIKIQSDPKVYAVAGDGLLRYVTTPAIAAKLYGTTWAKQVDDISDAFFVNYKVGDPITTAD